MSTEGYVQLPVDSTSNKNKFRVVETVPADGDGVTTVMQEVVSLGDDDGNLLLSGGVGEKALVVGLQLEILEQLKVMTQGIAALCQILHSVGRPDDTLPNAENWMAENLPIHGGQ